MTKQTQIAKSVNKSLKTVEVTCPPIKSFISICPNNDCHGQEYLLLMLLPVLYLILSVLLRERYHMKAKEKCYGEKRT